MTPLELETALRKANHENTLLRQRIDELTGKDEPFDQFRHKIITQVGVTEQQAQFIRILHSASDFMPAAAIMRRMSIRLQHVTVMVSEIRRRIGAQQIEHMSKAGYRLSDALRLRIDAIAAGERAA